MKSRGACRWCGFSYSGIVQKLTKQDTVNGGRDIRSCTVIQNWEVNQFHSYHTYQKVASELGLDIEADLENKIDAISEYGLLTNVLMDPLISNMLIIGPYTYCLRYWRKASLLMRSSKFESLVLIS